MHKTPFFNEGIFSTWTEYIVSCPCDNGVLLKTLENEGNNKNCELF